MKRIILFIIISVFLIGCRNYVAATSEGNEDAKTESEELKAPQIDDIYVHILSSDTTFIDLLSELGAKLEKDLVSYDYICENETVISGKVFNTAPFFLEGYLKPLALSISDLPTEVGESAVLLFKSGEKTYRIRLSDKYVIVYDKEGYNSVPIAVYAYTQSVPDLAELRLLLFREEQTTEYLTNTYTTVSATNDTLLKTNILYTVDLDGDGEDEELYVAFFGRSWNWGWGVAPDIIFDGEYATGEYIYVNKKLMYKRQDAKSPASEAFGLVSFSQSPIQYIITFDNGPSNDTESYVYMMKNDEIVLAGIVPDCLFSRGERVSATDTIESYFADLDKKKIQKDCIRYETEFCLIQMWNEKGVYSFDEEGVLYLSKSEFIPFDDDAFDLLYPVYVMKNSDGTGERTRIEAGKIFMDDTDGEKMVHIVVQDGSAEGWIDVEDPQKNLTEENTEKDLSGYDLFHGSFVAG